VDSLDFAYSVFLLGQTFSIFAFNRYVQVSTRTSFFFCEIELTFVAIVSLTGARVQNQSEKIWFYNRYAILVEYTERPRLPPPFIIISYTRKNFVRIHRFFCLHHHFLNISSTDPHCLSPMYPQVGNLFA
jgi:hypothetical protein